MALKVGDLCFIVNSEANNDGKVVTLVRFLGEQEWYNSDGTLNDETSWEITPPLANAVGYVSPRICQYQLKKIDNPGDEVVDESFAWLPPVPQLEDVHA